MCICKSQDFIACTVVVCSAVLCVSVYFSHFYNLHDFSSLIPKERYTWTATRLRECPEYICNFESPTTRRRRLFRRNAVNLRTVHAFSQTAILSLFPSQNTYPFLFPRMQIQESRTANGCAIIDYLILVFQGHYFNIYCLGLVEFFMASAVLIIKLPMPISPGFTVTCDACKFRTMSHRRSRLRATIMIVEEHPFTLHFSRLQTITARHARIQVRSAAVSISALSCHLGTNTTHELL